MDASRPVSFRPMQANDLSTIEQAFGQTWPSPMGSGTPIGSLGTRFCLMHYLSVSTRCEVAVDGEELLGVTLARVEGEPVTFTDAEARLKATALLLERHPAGSQLLEHTRAWYRAELRLEREAQLVDSTHAELELFLVMEGARGRGVGGRLFARVLDYFAECGVSGFFLHTDSDSDIGFYEHQGMRCVADLPDFVEPDELYIYAGQVRRID